MGDWAKDEAREWLVLQGLFDYGSDRQRLARFEGLAALLVEVEKRGWVKQPAERLRVLAEVRRVVLEQRPPGPVWPDKRVAERVICDEILSRLDKLA